MAHVTDLGFSMTELLVAIADGQVRVQTHPEKRHLSIFNYTEEVQYRNRWNKITLACRGLILDTDTGNIVARPWEKFFNLGQQDNEIAWNAPVEVTDKLDGSLGILYHDGDDWAIATRGSFASTQAIHATKVLQRYPKEWWDGVYTSSYTYLFEIIYPENRIVVNYNGLDDLVLLGAVHKQSGHYIGPAHASANLSWDGPVTEVFEYETFGDAVSAMDREGKEGYVIRAGRKIVKLKQVDYLELHKIVTNLSPKTIWESLVNDRSIDDICEQIPDEFHRYVEDIGNALLAQVSEINLNALTEYANIRLKLGMGATRKQFALEFAKSEYKKYLFLLLDGKSIEPVVWQSVKPRGDTTLVEDEG